MTSHWTDSIEVSKSSDGSWVVCAVKSEGYSEWVWHSVRRISRPERLLDAVLECAECLAGYSWSWDDAERMLAPILDAEMAEAVSSVCESWRRCEAECPVCHYPFERDRRCCRHFLGGWEDSGSDHRTGVRCLSNSDPRFVRLVGDAWSEYSELANQIAKRVGAGQRPPRLRRNHELSAEERAHFRKVVEAIQTFLAGEGPHTRDELVQLFDLELNEAVPVDIEFAWVRRDGEATSDDESYVLLWAASRPRAVDLLRERLRFLNAASARTDSVHGTRRDRGIRARKAQPLESDSSADSVIDQMLSDLMRSGGPMAPDSLEEIRQQDEWALLPDED